MQPFFTYDQIEFIRSLQGLVSMIVEPTSAMLQIWERKAECSGGNLEITVDEDLRRLSADMISRASFGTSQDEGAKILLSFKHFSG